MKSDPAIFQPNVWNTTPKQEFLNDVGPNRRPRHILFIGSGLTPKDAYVYLRARFGRPNGIQSFLRGNHSDNLVQWHFSLTAGTARLEFLGSGARLEIHVITDDEWSDEDWPRLVQAVKDDFPLRGHAMASVRNGLERWTLFVNPYCRLDGILKESARRLRDLEPDLRVIPKAYGIVEDMDQRRTLIEDLSKRQGEAASLGTQIRMLAPVLGEAFVNLLIFLLAKDTVRQDSRIYEATVRANIDVRVKSLHHNCDHFRSPIDGGHKAVGDFLKIMNHRNDFLHGNVDPKVMKAGEVFFDDRVVALFPVEQSLSERCYVVSLSHCEPEPALLDLGAVDSFVEYVVGRLENKVAAQVRAFLNDPLPGYRADTGKPGILFQVQALDFFFGTNRTTDGIQGGRESQP